MAWHPLTLDQSHDRDHVAPYDPIVGLISLANLFGLLLMPAVAQWYLLCDSMLGPKSESWSEACFYPNLRAINASKSRNAGSFPSESIF